MNNTPLILGVISAVVALFGGFVTLRNAGRANRITEGSQQLQWAQQAMAEATSAREDATAARNEVREVRAEAKAARDEAAGAMADLVANRRETQKMTGQIEGVMTWVDRVVRYAAAMRSEDQLTDPKVIRLLAIINGGPPEISGSQMPRPDLPRSHRDA